MTGVDIEAVKRRISERVSAADAEPFHRILDSVGGLRAELDALRAERDQQARVISALKDIIAMVNPCIHEQMVEAQKAYDEGRTITVEEYMARRGLALPEAPPVAGEDCTCRMAGAQRHESGCKVFTRPQAPPAAAGEQA